MLSSTITNAATKFARMITLNDLERRSMLFIECDVIFNVTVLGAEASRLAPRCDHNECR